MPIEIMAERHPHRGEPHWLHSLTEWRALLEMAMLPCALPFLAGAPRGDGHPVLLLPGFMADEATLAVLRWFLGSRGYDVQSWGFGRNVGFRSHHARALEQKIRHMHHATGRTVSLVGWSLGGVFALYGAHQAPECVRMVITLGSPVSVDEGGSRSPALVKALYRLVAHPMGPNVHVMQPRVKKLRERQPLPMPLSCLYSLSDGVVPPQEATVHGDPGRHENIRVQGSHTGLGFNPMVLAIVAERLAQPEDAWRPFNPEGWWGSAYRWATHESVPI
jgi:pimeloyl-ACP methyl ester carboxylesterase